MTVDPIEKVRDQYDLTPYPNLPATDMGGDGDRGVILHSYASAWYAKTQHVDNRQDVTILDVGCGSGVTTLALAIANPKARIVGIDLSETSLRLAGERLTYHGFPHVEFHKLAIAQLPQFKTEQSIEFDYINCEETLYLQTDIVESLRHMRTVLAPTGILRINVHSLYQRIDFFRAQAFSRLIGLLNSNPTNREYQMISGIMESLADDNLLKVSTWLPSDKSMDFVLMNYMLIEDKGYTIPDFFQMLRSANLEFIGMTEPAGWHLPYLFPNGMPDSIVDFWHNATPEKKLHAYELLHPANRLLDLWCGHSGRSPEYIEIQQWTEGMWKSAMIYLHPVVRTDSFFQTLERSIAQMQPDPYVQKLHRSHLDALTVILCLRFMRKGSCKFSDLLDYWCIYKPKLEAYRTVSTLVGAAVPTVHRMSDRQAYEELRFLLSELVMDRVVMLERSVPRSF